MSSSNKTIQSLITQADRLCAQDDFEAALKLYQEAIALDPRNTALYDKLIDTHERSAEAWDMDEFVQHLTWTMEKQKLENPCLEQVHQKLEPEFKEITRLIFDLARAEKEEDEEAKIEMIIAYGEKAILPLIEFIRTMKTLKDTS
jgi:tetratricopeptide (TPR) repeat protein